MRKKKRWLGLCNGLEKSRKRRKKETENRRKYVSSNFPLLIRGIILWRTFAHHPFRPQSPWASSSPVAKPTTRCIPVHFSHGLNPTVPVCPLTLRQGNRSNNMQRWGKFCFFKNVSHSYTTSQS